MGEALVNQLEQLLERVPWPDNPAATELGEQAYEMGLDLVDDYTGDPKVLQKALKTFLSGKSRPYAYAGAAYVLVAASKERDGSYSPKGLQLALSLLEQAQADHPDMPDLNFIEALVYIYQREFENARLVLDYLHGQTSYEYHLLLTEAIFWQVQGELDTMVAAYKEAAAVAETVPRKLQLFEEMGDAFMRAKEIERALENYKQAAYFSPETGRVWHKLSVIYWKQQDLENCRVANTKARKFGAGPEAEKLGELIQQKIEEKSNTGRLFGRR